MTTITTIPFAGFHDSELDNILERESEWAWEDEKRDVGLLQPCEYRSEYCDLLRRHTKWRAAHEYIAMSYVTYFNHYISENYDLQLALTFEGLGSPRFYNYSTDRIFCNIPEASVKEMYAAINAEEFKQTILDRFTSRSGFISFYSNDIRTWFEKPLEKWDCNEIGTMFLALLHDDQDFEWTIFERMVEAGVYEQAFSLNCDYKAVDEGMTEFINEHVEVAA